MDEQSVVGRGAGKKVALFLVFTIILIAVWAYTFTTFGEQIYAQVPALKVFKGPVQKINDIVFGKTMVRPSIAAECPYGYSNVGPAGCKRSMAKYDAPSKMATCPSGYANKNVAGCERPLASFNDPNYVATCPVSYTNNGPKTPATPNCGRNAHDIYAPSILKDCPDGYKNSGLGTCIPRIIGRGAGVVGDKVKVYGCPSHTPNHHGVWGAGWCDNGPTWPWDLDTSEETYTWKAQHEIPYSLSPGNQLPDPGVGKRVWVKSGLLFYPQCPSGMTADTANICRTEGPTTRTDFKPCKAGYRDHTAGRCRKICPTGYYNTGESCHRPFSILGPSNMTCRSGYFRDGYKCYKKCPPEYIFKDGKCVRPFSRLARSAFSCLPGYTRKDNKCYQNCKTLYNNTGEHCVRPESILPVSNFICPVSRQRGTGENAHRCYGDCRNGWNADGSICKDLSAFQKIKKMVGM